MFVFSDHRDSKFNMIIILPLILKDCVGQGARLFNSNSDFQVLLSPLGDAVPKLTFLPGG